VVSFERVGLDIHRHRIRFTSVTLARRPLDEADGATLSQRDEARNGVVCA
jgi:hypothetical protein